MTVLALCGPPNSHSDPHPRRHSERIPVRAHVAAGDPPALRRRKASRPHELSFGTRPVLPPTPPAPPPETAMGYWPRADRYRNDGGKPPGSESACPWPASCLRNKASALLRCRQAAETFVSAGTGLLPDHPKIPREIPGPWRHAASSG